MKVIARRWCVLVLVVSLLGVVAACKADEPTTVEPTDRLRGVNVVTLLTQAVTVFDNPDVTGTGEPQSSYRALAAVGHKLIRLAVDRTFLQPNLDTGDPTFHPAYWRAVKGEVAKIKAAGLKAVVGLHNGCEWTKPKTSKPPLVCGAGLSTQATTDVWRQISREFRTEPAVIAYDLFNEPTKFNHPTRTDVVDPGKQPYATYRDHINAVVAAIRNNRDDKGIWVQPLCCASYLDFASTDPNGGWVIDPLNRITYSQHMYPVLDSNAGEQFNPAKLDADYEQPAGAPWADRGYTRGFLGRLDDFGGWCGRHQVKCSIGEVGWYGLDQSDDAARQWNELGDKWYNMANYYGLAVTYWGASSALRSKTWAYDTPGPNRWFPAPGLTRKLWQASIIEKPEHLSKP